MSNDKNDDKKMTAQEAALIELLKQQNLQGSEDGGKTKHAFWDTQVRQRLSDWEGICSVGSGESST